uniref:Oligopeptide transporter 1 n=1 Tax=Dermatophagoides pteronyssinus TaxID=6956 RepID=A0A6P6YDG6_DERPT|nr:solute carrier family 15 member 2-like isoform X2 [Dermatophagoides pteronyssinus]XP_027203331.1 solute carrier family 15 member 2-like isoform X2 [Dermatophagoides pteronyssinus]
MTKNSDSYAVDKENEGEKKIPYPKSILFIIGNEFCERFSFYGMRTILILYFKYVLLFEDDFATQIYHIFVMACYFTPVFGAILADSYLGKYWTILSISCLYAAGNIFIAGASITGTIWSSFIGLTLIAIGTGGIKPCVSAFGGDQFQPGQEQQLRKFFSLFYIAINSGSLVSTFLTPILRQDVSCFGRSDCYPLAFGVPAILMVVALLLFIMGKFVSGYTINPPEKDNVVFRVFSCIGRAICRRFFSSNSTKKEHWIDYADDKYDNKTRKDVKALLRVLFLYIPLPIFWALFDQQASRWTLQAIRMNHQLTSHFIIKPDQIQVINPLLVILFVPIFDYLVYPVMKKIGLYTPLKRMVIGSLLASLSFCVCGFFQRSIEAEAPASMIPGYNHLAIVNNMPQNLTILSNITIMPNEIKMIDNMNRSLLESEFGKENLTDGKTLVLYYDTEIPVTFIWNNTLVKPDTSGARLFTIFDLKNFDKDNDKFSIIGHKDDLITNIVQQTNDGRTIGYLNEFEVEIIGKDIVLNIGKNRQMTYPKMGEGATYIQIIDGDLNTEPISRITGIVDANKLSVFLQLIQYIIMTAGEILFSITGLEFSYSQAPKSMKSVLQAAWLLTVAFGNLIVAIITLVKFERQSYEVFFFFGLMFIDSLIFAVMAYFYVPYKGDDDDDEDDIDERSSDRQQLDMIDGGSSTTTSTRPSTENLSMKQIHSTTTKTD